MPPLKPIHMNYTRFNRHEIFTAEDMKAVGDAIDSLELDNPTAMLLVNSLYGLYDGYLYDNLAEGLFHVLDFETFCNIQKTIQKIERLTDIADGRWGTGQLREFAMASMIAQHYGMEPTREECLEIIREFRTTVEIMQSENAEKEQARLLEELIRGRS